MSLFTNLFMNRSQLSWTATMYKDNFNADFKIHKQVDLPVIKQKKKINKKNFV